MTKNKLPAPPPPRSDLMRINEASHSVGHVTGDADRGSGRTRRLRDWPLRYLSKNEAEKNTRHLSDSLLSARCGNRTTCVSVVKAFREQTNYSKRVKVALSIKLAKATFFLMRVKWL